MSVFYKGFLDSQRCVTGKYTGTLGGITKTITEPVSKPYFYYEGQLKEFTCKKEQILKVIPHGSGTMWSIYDVKSIVSGIFDFGQIGGFMNVIIPEKGTEIDCNYIEGKPDKSSSYMITRSSEFQLNIK